MESKAKFFFSWLTCSSREASKALLLQKGTLSAMDSKLETCLGGFDFFGLDLRT